MLNKEEFKKEAETFDNLYKKLIDLIKSECRKFEIKVDTDVTKLRSCINLLTEKNNIIKHFKDDLNFILDIKDICIKYNGNTNYDYTTSPNPNINYKLKKIIDIIENPPLISKSKIMIKWDDIYKREITDNVFETIKTMSEKVYTYVPILENNKFIGVFSGNIILDIIEKEQEIILNEKTDFSEFRETIKVENHSMEKFKFISKNKNICEKISRKIFMTFKNYLIIIFQKVKF